jgi:simple sugar transport system permease protein
MFAGALGSQQGLSYTVTYVSPFVLAALAFLVPGKAGIWNVGGQGQAYLGGIAAAFVALYVPMPPILWPVVALIVGALAGALGAAIPGILESYRNASAIVTTIMLNYVYQPLASFLLFFIIAVDFPTTRVANQTPKFASAATIPQIPGLSSSVMVFFTILIAVAVQYFLLRTTLGYKIRAVGLNPTAAEMKGINWKRMKVVAMMIGGMLAGLAGASEILGTYRNYVDQFAEGYFGGLGFAGIAVALVGASSPIGSIFSALLFAIMVSGAPYIQALGIPRELVWSLQGIIILFASMPYLYNVITKTDWSRAWRKNVISPGKTEGQ